MFEDFGIWIVVGVGVSLGLTGLRWWAPKAGARRVAERGSLIGPAIKPTFEEEAMRRTGNETLANKQLHDELLREALSLKVRARTGEPNERLATIDRAIEKVEDALSARPSTYDGTKLLGELFLDKARLMEGVGTVAPLERAAQLFAEAASYRKGVIDNYVGRGWSYLEMTRVDPEYGAIYAVKAADALAAGFQCVPQNVFVLRGWGMALDRYARAPDSDPAKLAELEVPYRAALGIHRGGTHDLFEWYQEMRRAAQPIWVDVPPLRDVY